MYACTYFMYLTCKYIFKLCICLSALCMYVCVCARFVAQFNSNSLWCYGLQPASFLCPWDFPGKNTGVGCHALPQGMIPNQQLNPCLLYLLHWQAILLPLSHLGSPCICTGMHICTSLYMHMNLNMCINAYWCVYLIFISHNITHSAYMFLINFLYRV